MTLRATGNTQFYGQSWTKQGADVATAATVDLGAILGQVANLTGSVTVTSFGTGAQDGAQYTLQTVDGTTFTNSGTLVCPGGVDLTTEAGDIIIVTKMDAAWYVSNPINDDDVVNQTFAKRVDFVDGDLTGGIFTFTHNLNITGAITEVRDNNGKVVTPSDVDHTSVNAVDFDLGVFQPLTGTWRATVMGTNAV